MIQLNEAYEVAQIAEKKAQGELLRFLAAVELDEYFLLHVENLKENVYTPRFLRVQYAREVEDRINFTTDGISFQAYKGRYWTLIPLLPLLWAKLIELRQNKAQMMTDAVDRAVEERNKMVL